MNDTPSNDTPSSSCVRSSTLQQLHEARLKWKEAKQFRQANEFQLRKYYRECEWKYFDESIRKDNLTKTVSINFKHMSDDFMERHYSKLIQEFKQQFDEVIVVCDRHTVKYCDNVERVIVR
ncbi:Hypothetical_protein [Hexamita inflata]|uniref:Hypothetical_protein n=1 Tax=Hexamita inflata TaxID=28002 RepID=A0AA86V860_9EUKA|nr:Hypothetical protein HINF_LOCUS46623 [Hexamita inflata]